MKKKLLICVLVFVFGNRQANAQWVQTSGPVDGNVYSLVISPNGTGGTNLFAGTDGAGIFLSTDNGSNWNAVNNGLTNGNIWALAVTPYASGKLFAGTDDGVFLSTDNGTSWNASGLAALTVYALVFSRNLTGDLFAGTDGGGVFLSTNNGATWTPVNTALTNDSVNAFAVSPNGISGTNLFAGTTGGGVFLSTNNGASWTATGLTNNYVYSLAANGSNVFAGTLSDGVFLSTDNGANWHATGLTNPNVNALSFNGTNIFAGTNDGVFLSTNSGTDWFDVNTGMTNVGVFALAIGPVLSGNLFAGTDSGGVWKRPLSQMVTSVRSSSDDVPTKFMLQQNYPNPFNPVTQIHFSVPSAGYVSLKIYDLLGKEIATLVTQTLHVGSYTTDWNSANMASGVYLYRLQAGEYTATKKLVLMK
ncbi:MAG: T9SS type A sorting domain-containing protein [Bacteroidota bacterium]